MNKITKIKITKEEYKNISKYTAIPIGIVFLEEKKGCYLQGNKEDFEKLLDRLSNYFVEHGIDQNKNLLIILMRRFLFKFLTTIKTYFKLKTASR